MLPGYFGDMIKAVVDVKQCILGLDAELHADIEKELLAQGGRGLYRVRLPHQHPSLSGQPQPRCAGSRRAETDY